MKRKSVRILLLSIGTVLVLGLCVFKFAEEIVTIKGKVYPPVVAFVKDLLSADPDVSEYSPVVHSGNEWYFSVPLIYHAAGGIDGLVYSNSKEALEHTLSQGNTFVEIDFMYTSDGHLVCVHDWDTLVGGGTFRPTLEEFQSLKIFGKYSPMTAEDLVSYMAEHEALHIIIDAKDDLVQVVSDLVRLSREAGVTDRLIIQLYGEGDKEKILELYPFADENFLLTLYKYGADRLADILALCYNENIRVITLPYGSWDQETIELFFSKNFVLFEHTVNRPDHANSSIQKGIHGLYTDFLQPDDLNLAARP